MIRAVLDLGGVDPVRPDRTLVDPAGQGGDLGGGQAASGRHELVLVVAGEEVDQRAVLGPAGNDVRAVVVAALERLRLDVETQAGLLLRLAVTVVAVLLEDRAHLADEIDRRGGRGGGQEQEKRAEARDGHESTQLSPPEDPT